MMKKRLAAMRQASLLLVPREGLEPHGVTRLILSQVRLPFRHPGISCARHMVFQCLHKKNYTITNGTVKYF